MGFPSGNRGRGGGGGGCYTLLGTAAYGDGLLVRGAVVPEVPADANATRDALFGGLVCYDHGKGWEKERTYNCEDYTDQPDPAGKAGRPVLRLP